MKTPPPQKRGGMGICNSYMKSWCHMSGTITLHPSRQGACQENVPEPNTHHLSLSCCTQSSATKTLLSHFLRGLLWHILCPLIAPAVKYEMTAIYCRVYKNSRRAFRSGGSSGAACEFYTRMGNACEDKLFFFLNWTLLLRHTQKRGKKSREFQQLMQNQRCDEQSHHYMSEGKLILKGWNFALKAKNI